MSRHKPVPERPKDVLYLAVLPRYRQACVTELTLRAEGSLILFSGDRQLDSSVKTGVAPNDYVLVKNVGLLGGRILFQWGNWGDVLKARSAILDLNPRSISAWVLLIGRRIVGRRTLLWGHLHPRSGANSPTARLRRFMRGLAHGSVLYGYDSVPAARSELPCQPVWVAPNSLYTRSQMGAVARPKPGAEEPSIVYVGRLVSAKKVELAIRALSEKVLVETQVHLKIVGGGSEESRLRMLARELGVERRVHFLGWMDDPEQLREIYSEAVCAVSPGYAGLSLTQSLGFGVPVVVARDEPHAPEIELVRLGGVTFFESDSPASLARAIEEQVRLLAQQDRNGLASRVTKSYSAEAMADGILRALRAEPQHLKKDGWPADESQRDEDE